MLDVLKRRISIAAMAQQEARARGDRVGAAAALGEMQHCQGQHMRLLREECQQATTPPASFADTDRTPTSGRLVG
jgi:hypothetical protein